MNSWNLLNGPIKKMSDEEIKSERDSGIKQIIENGEEKKQRVLRFLGSNSHWKIEKIVEKFDLSHDVSKDFGNGMVKVAFYADESMRIVCFELDMAYSDVIEVLK